MSGADRRHLAARREAAPAGRRDRDLRRRPPRPPGGDQGLRHGPHLRPPPARGPAPGGDAEADHAVPGQARRDRRPRGRGARRDPVRPRVRLAAGRGVHRGRPDRPPRRRARLGRRELPLRRQSEGRPGDARRPPRVRDPGRAAGRGRRRDGLLDPDPGADRGRGHGGRAALPRGAVHGRGRGRHTATSAAASSGSRPRTSSPTTASRSPATGSTRPSPTASRRRSTSASARPSTPAAGC